jgi:hypothetical protein
MIWMRRLEQLAWRYEFDSDEKYFKEDRLDRFANILKYLRNHGSWDIANSDIELRPKEKAKMREKLSGEIDPKWPALRNVLLRLEQALNGGRPPWDIRGGFTIEHVLPRSGGGVDWEKATGKTNAELRRLALRLGNLCFVTQNKRMGELTFPEKLAIIEESDDAEVSKLTGEVCRQSNWCDVEINSLTDKYVRALAKDLDLT